MSIATHRNRMNRDRGAIISNLLATIGYLRSAAIKSTKLFMHAVNAVAEARAQRALIEAELYRRRYKHSSKNDDDLPIVR